MQKGRLTIPTDETYVEGTKKFIEYWNADAVRDCDGVSLPKDVKQFGTDVYKAYFIVREDHEYAKAHPEFWQNTALISERYTAKSDVLDIDLLKNTFKESLAVNTERYREFWQVIDRTTGQIHESWEYLGNDVVRITNAKKYHEYTVNFFAKNTWDPVQIYNYHVNNWTCEKDIYLDPVYLEALNHMLFRMEKWLKENPDVTVVRFTTFFYNFLIVNVTGIKQRIWDWHNYAMTASPAMFDLFRKETGEAMTLENLIGGGYYSNRFTIPDETMRKYIDFVQKKCSEWAKLFVDLCHKYGKKALMFDGDHRIGVEPYSPYFPSIGLDGVVGAPSSAIYAQQVADIDGVKFTEGRLNPYFFPNECPGDERGTQILNMFWDGIRRGLMKKPIDRIGFGGYLKQIENYEKLKVAIKDACDDFRTIGETIGEEKCFTKANVAVISYWGRLDTFMMNGIFVDDPRQDGFYYTAMLTALAILPVNVEFISFDDVVNGDLSKYDVIVSDGIPGTSFQGDKCWKNPLLTAKIREFVDNGGGFIGVGEPSGYQYQGRFLQLSDVLGVEKECNFRHFEKRDEMKPIEKHYMTDGIDMSKIAFNPNVRGMYPLSADVIKMHYDETYPYGWQNAGHVDLAVNEYGKGRSIYLSGISPSNESYRLIYNAILWACGKENERNIVYSSNPNVDAYYYSRAKKYGLINSTNEPQCTEFYDKSGYKSIIELKPKQIRWIEIK